MIRRILLAVIFAAAICGAAFAIDDGGEHAADDSGVTGREEIAFEPPRKERMAPGTAGPGVGMARAAIDMEDPSLPKPPVEEVEASADEEVPAVQAAPIEEVFEPQEEAPVLISESHGEVNAAAPAEAQAEEIHPVLKKKAGSGLKFTVPWRSGPKKKSSKVEPKKKQTKEEELDTKIQNRSFWGETGFTTVTTYRNKGVKVSGAEPMAIPPKGAPVTLDIDDCIRIAEQNHIQALVAKKSIKLAEMRLFEARRNMLPSVTIVVERSKGRVSDNNYLGRKQYIEGQQPIYHGGELYFTMKQAEVNLQIARNDHQRVKNDLVLQVKKAYYTLEKAKENSALQHALSKEVERVYNISSKGYEAGAVAKVEYLNVNSQVSQAKYQLASADGDASVAELILKQTMNVNMRDNFEIAASPEFRRVTLDFEKTLQDAFMNRPEIKANALMVTYYNYGKGIANAKSLPKVDLLGQWGVAWEDYIAGSEDLTSGLEPRRNLQPQWYAGIKASVPFAGSTAEYSYTREQWVPVVQTTKGTEATTNSFKFKILDRLDMYSDKQLANIDYDRSRGELNKTKNDVVLEIREGCFNYEKALIQLETAGNKVKYQEADAELMRMKRGMDEVQDSNVVDSLIKVAQEKFGYVQAVTDCKISLAALEKAIGVEDYFKNR